MLELFPEARAETLLDAARRPLPDLESGTSSSWQTAWNTNLRYSQSTAHAHLTDEIIGEKLDQFYRLSGQRIGFPRSPIGNDPRYAGPWGQARKAVDDWNATQPEDTLEMQSSRFRWPTQDQIDAEVLKRSRLSLEEDEREKSRPQTLGSTVGRLGADVAGAVTEPWNIAFMGMGSPAAAGILRFALTEAGLAAVGQTAAEIQSYGFKKEVNPQHSISAAAGEVATAAAGGFVVGGTLKSIATAWRAARDRMGWSRDVMDAGNVVTREAEIADRSPFPGAEGEFLHRAAMQKAADDLAAGRPVDLSTVLPPEVLRPYTAVLDARGRAAAEGARASDIEAAAGRLPPTMERLSELQLRQFREAPTAIEARAIAARHMFDEDSAAIGLAREQQAGRLTELQAARADAQQIRQELDAVRAQADEVRARIAIDPATQSRLHMIDAALPKATKGQRARLERERATITETLEQTAPREQHALASLEQQAAGLETLLARRERAAAKLFDRTKTVDQQLTVRDAALEGRRRDLEAKTASQHEAALEQTRRGVARLAKDGYEVRLAPDEAREIAQRIIRAPDAEVDDVLRGVTEDLVARSRAQQPDQLSFGASHPADQARARSVYWDNEMRKAIQALGREVGAEITPAEARAIAEQIRTLPEERALALVNELLPLSQDAASALRIVSRASDRVADMEPIIEQATTPKAIAAARNAPATHEAMITDAARLLTEKPDFEIRVPVTQADGSVTYVARRLDDALADLDHDLAAAKDMRACAIGRDAA